MRLQVAIQHDYENHDEAHDHTAVRLQLRLSIFEQNFDILEENVSLLDVCAPLGLRNVQVLASEQTGRLSVYSAWHYFFYTLSRNGLI